MGSRWKQQLQLAITIPFNWNVFSTVSSTQSLLMTLIWREDNQWFFLGLSPPWRQSHLICAKKVKAELYMPMATFSADVFSISFQSMSRQIHSRMKVVSLSQDVQAGAEQACVLTGDVCWHCVWSVVFLISALTGNSSVDVCFDFICWQRKWINC